MIAAIFSWALTKAGAATLAIVLAVAAIGGLALHDRLTGQALTALRDHDRAAAADARARTAAGQSAGKAAQVQVAQARELVRTVTRTLIEKVPAYVPPAADRACVVPVGFVQLHDAAAAGLPAPAGGPDPAASGLALSAVAATVAENYGIAFDWRAEALGWRAWYLTQKAIWDAPSPSEPRP